MSQIVCIGEALIDLLADDGAMDLGSSERFSRAAGGAVANVAAGIARLGGVSRFIGAVGSDPFGDFLVRALDALGVDTGGMVRVDDQTGIIFVARGADGSRDFLPAAGAIAHFDLSPDVLDRELLGKASAVHAGGYMLARDPARSATVSAMRLGAACGLVTFDMNVRPRGFDDRASMRRTTVDAAALAHLVKASEDDLALLDMIGDDPAQLLRGSTVAAVVTKGSDGCRWATIDGRFGAARAPRVEVVDTTGAGDAFMAALLWRTVEHHGRSVAADAIDESVRFACAAGALACTRIGAIAAMPTAAQVHASIGAWEEHRA